MKRLLCLGLLALIGCGRSDEESSFSAYRQAELQQLSAIHKAGWDNYQGTIVWKDGNPSYPQNQGNANLFHGLLCWSGDQASCELAISLRCPTGHLKRAPWRVCGDESRDEFIGQAFVALKTKSVFSLPGSYPFSVTPVWARTMKLAGFNISAPGDHALLLAQAKSVPANYELHLVALQAWVRRIKGEDTQALDLVFVELRKRHPSNIFYKYLRAGGATKEIIDEFLAWAPKTPVLQQAYWPYEKPPSEYSNAKAHSASIVFMANLLAR